MSVYVIGIGGTGSKIIESLIHVSAAGLIDAKETVNLFFVDADVANGNGNRTLQVKELYDNVKSIDGLDMHQTQVQYKKDKNGNDVYKWNILNNEINTLEKLFTNDFANGNAASKLFTVLYSGEELKEDLNKGFKGHPNIGSLVITKNINLEQDPWTSLFEDVNKEVNGGMVKIIVCGSVFGGTGAAGIPTISKILFDKFKPVNNVSIHGIIMLPYFSFKDLEDTGLKARSEKFIENTKYALEYYHNEKYYDYYQKLYLIGDEVLQECPVPAMGGDEQKNPALLPELIAALAIKDIIADNSSQKIVNYCNKYASAGQEDKDPWSGLPITLEDKNKLIQYLLYSLHYVNVYSPLFNSFINNREIPRSESWAINFFQNRRIDLFNNFNQEAIKNAEYFCSHFIRWMKDIFSADPYNNFINTSLFANTSNQIRHMNDLRDLLKTRLDRKICYDKVYKSVNSYKLVSDSKSVLGTFFDVLYRECKI